MRNFKNMDERKGFFDGARMVLTAIELGVINDTPTSLKNERHILALEQRVAQAEMSVRVDDALILIRTTAFNKDELTKVVITDDATVASVNLYDRINGQKITSLRSDDDAAVTAVIKWLIEIGDAGYIAAELETANLSDEKTRRIAKITLDVLCEGGFKPHDRSAVAILISKSGDNTSTAESSYENMNPHTADVLEHLSRLAFGQPEGLTLAFDDVHGLSATITDN